MAKIPVDIVATKLESLMLEGRAEDARRHAIEHLRNGHSSPDFLSMVAYLLEGHRLKVVNQRHWLEISSDYDDLRAKRLSREAAIEELQRKKYGGRRWGRRTIEKALADYNRAQKAAESLR